MESRSAAIWSKVGWALLVIFCIVILVATWVEFNGIKSSRTRLVKSRDRLEAMEKVVKDYDELETSFDDLHASNSRLAERIKGLNKIVKSLDLFVVADLDQINAHSTGSLIMDFNWEYRGYVPIGRHVFELAVYESDSKFDTERDRPQYSVQFEILGPTKFEIACRGKGSPYDSVDLTLHLPEKLNAQQETVEFEKQFSFRSKSRLHNERAGLPSYPSEFDVRANYNPSFKAGVVVGDLIRFETKLAESRNETGHLAFLGTLHSDAKYCIKTGDALINRYAIGLRLGMQSYSADQILDLLIQDPELTSRMFIEDGLNEGMRQRPTRGERLEQ
ncbi:MAG: hypothetical protein AB8B55_06670 [Mariniblastus sp.]